MPGYSFADLQRGLWYDPKACLGKALSGDMVVGLQKEFELRDSK